MKECLCDPSVYLESFFPVTCKTFLYRHIKRCPNPDSSIHRNALKLVRSVELMDAEEPSNAV